MTLDQTPSATKPVLSRRFSVAPMMDRTDSCNFSLFIKKLQNQKNLL